MFNRQKSEISDKFYTIDCFILVDILLTIHGVYFVLHLYTTNGTMIKLSMDVHSIIPLSCDYYEHIVYHSGHVSLNFAGI